MVKVISVLAVSLLSAVSYAQCSRVISTGQVLCPSYSNSTPPIGYGPSTVIVNGRQAAWGAGQMGAGAATAYFGRGNPVAIDRGAINMAQGYDRWQANTYRQPTWAVPAQRPYPNYR